MPNWYDEAFFLLHYEHNYSLADSPPALSGFDRKQAERLLREIDPDAVQYTAKGAAGYVPYVSGLGNSLPGLDSTRPGILSDLREVTADLGIRLVLGCSGLIDYQAAAVRPDWQRVRSDGMPYPNRALCPNTGYVEELLLPQLEEILERYRPDGIWMDAESWTVSPCYCNDCEREYLLLHSRSAPASRQDPWWPEWIQFHRDTFDRYVQRVARYLHDRSGELVYASNGGFASHQPELTHGGPERLTWDLSPAFSLRQASMEARALGSNSVPFDLMTWSRCSPRPNASARLPALPAYPKTWEHLAQEAAVILANGGRWTVGMRPYGDDAFPEAEHAVVARAAEWARARREWCHDTDSAAYAAVLHSAAAHRKAGNGLYDPGPSLDRLRGAHQALLELHHPHDILNEQALPALLDCYRVLILPEQVVLPHALDEPIESWVRRGGRLIASGRVSPRIIEDIPTFALEEVLGIRWTGRTRDEGFFLHRELPLRIAAPTYEVTLQDAETVVPLVASEHELRRGESGHPAVSRCRFGDGEAFYIAADFFAAYHRCQYPGLRELLGTVLDLALPQSPLLTTAPPTVEITLRERSGRTIVNLVNHAPGKSLAQNSAYVESVPPTEPFSLTLAVAEKPAEVRLQPGDAEPDWSWSEGALTVFIPSFHIHALLVLTSGPAAEESRPFEAPRGQ